MSDVSHPDDQDPFVIDDSRPTQRNDELDGLRIRHIAVMRRAIARSRSYALVGMGVCLVAAIQFAIMVVKGSGLKWGVFVALAAWGGLHFWKKAERLRSEYERSALTDPATTPDFSTLNDGSQRWRNLEDVE